ncbi:hypothetical protein B296_00017389 [Ensete ventricosum]|uniref:Uncharacterized protein n=1 Tax=Ensete ventricosum TaxID=4639 RepID=A0A426ZP57_ENSVE|nr:hypothetical protein B296_00017389 [Ensete ventricosum]
MPAVDLPCSWPTLSNRSERPTLYSFSTVLLAATVFLLLNRSRSHSRRSYLYYCCILFFPSSTVSIVLQSTTTASSCLHRSSLPRTPFPLFQLSPGSAGRGDFLPPPSTQIYDRSTTKSDRMTPSRSAMRGSRQSPVNYNLP